MNEHLAKVQRLFDQTGEALPKTCCLNPCNTRKTQPLACPGTEAVSQPLSTGVKIEALQFALRFAFFPSQASMRAQGRTQSYSSTVKV